MQSSDLPGLRDGLLARRRTGETDPGTAVTGAAHADINRACETGGPVQGSGDDKEARFTALYERHYGDVLRYAARRAGPEAAAEVAAETFLTAWRRLDAVPAGEPLPWLYVTARQCLANELRKQERRQRLDARMQVEAGAGAQARLSGPAR